MMPGLLASCCQAPLACRTHSKLVWELVSEGQAVFLYNFGTIKLQVADFGLSKLKEYQASAASKNSNYEDHNPRWLVRERVR